MAGVRPILADKLVYHEDRHFIARLASPPVIEPMSTPNHTALASQLLRLQQDVAELRAIVVRRALTKTEIDNPASIPADALMSLSNVLLDLENISEEALNALVT